MRLDERILAVCSELENKCTPWKAWGTRTIEFDIAGKATHYVSLYTRVTHVKYIGDNTTFNIQLQLPVNLFLDASIDLAKLISDEIGKQIDKQS